MSFLVYDGESHVYAGMPIHLQNTLSELPEEREEVKRDEVHFFFYKQPESGLSLKSCLNL